MDGDVVLVHGLLSSKATWTSIEDGLRQVPALTGLGIDTFGYDSKLANIMFSPRRIPQLEDLAEMLDERLKCRREPHRPLALVGHSQGGLVIQKYLARLIEAGRATELERLRLVVLLACPCAGSDYLRSLRELLGLRRHPQIGRLARDHPSLDALHMTMLEKIVYASEDGSHSWRVPVEVFAGASDRVVSSDSAKRFFPDASTLPGDHFSILKATGEGEQTVRTLARLLIRHLDAAVSAPPPASSEGPTVAADPEVGTRSAVHVLRHPPNLVPGKVLGRADTTSLLCARIANASVPLTTLLGPSGIGRTAILCDLFRKVRERELHLDAVSYATPCGLVPVNVMAVLADLAAAAPSCDAAGALAELLNDPSLNWLNKLDAVLGELGQRRVLLVVDDAELLVDTHGYFADRGFEHLLLAIAQRTGHSVQVLLATSRPLASREAGLRREDAVSVARHLSYPEAVQLLYDFDSEADSKALIDATDTQLHQAFALTAGFPRALELLHCAVAGARPGILPGALEVEHVEPGRLRLRMLDEAVNRLSRPLREVVHAVAALGRPAPVDAVAQVLGRPVGSQVEHLADLRILRRWEGGYCLPPTEAEHLLASLPAGCVPDVYAKPMRHTRAALLLRAADYYKICKKSHPDLHVADLGPHLAEIELRVAAGQYGEAFEVMNRLDEQHLEPTGHSDMLSGCREQLLGRLPTPHDEVRVLLAIANAKSQQEQTDDALDALERADVKNDEVSDAANRSHNRVVLLLARAGVQFDAGRSSPALRDYDRVLSLLADEDPSLEKAQALAGGALHLLEVGQVPEAEQRLRLSVACLAALPPGDTWTATFRLELDLNLAVIRAYRDAPFEALQLLHRCRDEALGRDQAVLAARTLNAMTVAYLIADDLHAARAHALEASARAADLGDRDFRRTAFGTLALTALLLGGDEHLEDAVIAATAALGFGNDRRSWSHWVVRGMALLATGEVQRAHADFSRARQRAEEVLEVEPLDTQVLEHHALALVGLVLCDEPERRVDALCSFRKARERTREPGLVRLCRLRLNVMLARQDPAEWRDVRLAAG